jgi:hypothetical protein
MLCKCCRRKEARPGLKECEECATKHNATNYEARKLRSSKGLCKYCSTPSEGKRLCPKCAESKNSSGRERRARLKKSDSCMNCGDLILYGTIRCYECNKKHRAAEKQRKASLIAVGMCVRCCIEKSLPSRRWCAKCAADHNTRCKQREFARKLAVFNAYGGPKCACCGETIFKFLTIDHINNDGAEHRRSLKNDKSKSSSGQRIYCWLKKNNFPPGFQVLCFNCNCGKSLNNGICPHKDAHNTA